MVDPPTSPSVLPHRSLKPNPALDGLRGLAIVAVLATHVVFLDRGSPTWSLRGGFLGVDVFLGLSAFLIAAVLLRELDRSEEATGEARFDAPSFSRRRFMRIYPSMVILVVITGVVAVAMIGRDLTERIRSSVPALLSLANWQQSWGDPLPFELVHLWSLSLEVQFYVLMALGFWAARRHLHRPRLLIGLMLAGALAVSLWRLLLLDQGVALAELYVRTDTRADSMFLGVAAAIAWRSGLISDGATRLLGSVSALFLAAAFVFAEVDSLWLYRGGFTIVGGAAALVVMAVATGPGTVTSISGWAPIRWIGEISYSLYMWHLPIYVWTVMLLGDRRPLVAKVGVAVPVSILAGWASYRLVERRALAPWRRTGVFATRGTPTGRTSADRTDDQR